MNYNIIAIEPNRTIKESYEDKFRGHIKVYRDKQSFEKAYANSELYEGFKEILPVKLVMETTFSEELEDRLEDAPHVSNYPKRMFETLTDTEKERKSYKLGLGLQLAKDIRAGKYSHIDKNIPIIFATWLSAYGAEREITPIRGSYYVGKESIVTSNRLCADKEKLCQKLEGLLQKM
jgi:hypothetical protein